jgi:uncharacterized protein YjcR
MLLADLAKIYAITPRTARKWAREDRWRTMGKPVRYSLADAQRSYEARHHGRGRVVRHLVRRYGTDASGA